MAAIDVRLDLDSMLIVEKNESSADEPYLWVAFMKVDATTLNLTNMALSFVELHTPDGSHGNLGQASQGIDLGQTAIIPPAIGRFDTTLVTTGLPPGIGDALSFVAVAVMGLEEDASKNSAVAAGHQAMVTALQAALNQAIQTLSLPSGGQVANQVQPAVTKAMTDATVSGWSFFPISSLLDVGGVFDPDDFVGASFAGPFNFKQIHDAGSAGIPFIMPDLFVSESGNGKYRISGRVSRRPFVKFAGLFTPGQGSQQFVAGDEFNGFVSFWKQLANQHPPVDMLDFSTYLENGQRRFSGVFSPGKGGQQFVAGVDFNGIVKLWKDFGALKPPVDLLQCKTYMEGGGRKYAALFGPGQGGQHFVSGDDFPTFVALWKQLGAQHPPVDLISLDAFNDGPVLRFVGVFSPGKGGQHFVAGDDFNTFVKLWSDLGKQHPPVDMTDFTYWIDNNVAKFAGVFSPGAGGQHFVAGDDFDGFVALWSQLGAAHPPVDLRRLVVLEA